MKLYKEMKRKMTKYIALTGGLLMLGGLSGCKLDDPVIPAEELYIRGFIKEFGLIDPEQDFSSAVQTTVTLNLPGKASVVNVYAQMGDDLYRVGCFAELEGTVDLPVDVSEATETIVVDVDGVRYVTTPAGTVDVMSGMSRAASRADDNSRVPESELTLEKLWINPSEWSATTAKSGEDGLAYGARKTIVINKDGELGGPVGATETVSGVKYFNVKETAHVGKKLVNGPATTTIIDPETIKYNDPTTGKGVNYVAGKNAGEVSNTALGSNVTFLIQNRDEALSAYTITFRTASKNDAKVRVMLLGQQTMNDTEYDWDKGEAADVPSTDNGLYVFMDSRDLSVKGKYASNATVNTTDDGKYTEWELRTEMLPRGYYELVIIGMEAEANNFGDNTCGNWGFITMKRNKTAKEMSWILACEDLGSTDDFDFNDVVFSIEAVTTNTAAIKLGVSKWQVVEQPFEGGNEGTVIRPGAPARHAPVSRADATEMRTRVRVTALAAGGTLPIWLHFREEESDDTGTDYLVCPGSYDSKNEQENGCLVKASTIASAELSAEKSPSTKQSCSEWHRWFGETNSRTMINTGTTGHRDGESVTFYTNKPFSLENFCYLRFRTNASDGQLPYYFDEHSNLDPWSRKVLQWQWQQENSQEVTFGFFLTVYEPTVAGSSSVINDKDKESGYKEEETKTEGSQSHILSKSLAGLPPQMFLIPDCDSMGATGYGAQGYYGWCWPCERIDIRLVYPNFQAWVNESGDYYGINWFMLPKKDDPTYKLYPRDPKKQPGFEWTPPAGM